MTALPRLVLALCLALPLSTPSRADVAAALDDHILPGFSAFADAAAALSRQANADCRAEEMRPAFHRAFDAWTSVADLHIGPSETGALSIAFWPDPRGFTGRSLLRLIADEDPVISDPAAFATVSIAARGLFALDMLLFDPALSDYGAGSYSCRLARAIALDLATQSRALSAAWSGPFAEALRSAGEPGNTIFLSRDEALRTLYTQVLSALEFTADQRLGQPLGTFDRPRPARAEARRSERSLRNVVLAAEAAHALATALAGHPLPESTEALDRVHRLALRLQDPGLQDIADPQARLRAEALQQQLRRLRTAIEAELGDPLGLAPGFNSLDGD